MDAITRSPAAPTGPDVTRLADYRPPDWLVPTATLRFELAPERTLVHARLELLRNGQHDRPLRLDGDSLELLALAIDGAPQPLPAPSGSGLTLALRGDRAVIETVTAIHPVTNTRLMGLYASGGNLCTQCEPEGFRRITFFPDRPDILTRFRVRLEADRAAFPVLLANGNPGAAGELPGGRHFAEWDDPFPKPSYLFAAVAGRLEPCRDRFTTMSGRHVDLAIWVAAEDVPRTAHAMESLKAAMRWDEEHYGREYDLDVFNIVAVHDFNFGAMENKGLNIFNARYILADPETATDFDLDAVSAVVAHEYFHNWSGNRVTCRDWFQLSLKEGFTVFREQQFTHWLGSPAVRRIEEARALRAFQFPEDAGPLAHPVQPDHYLEISNFYTATVYNKGAELIGMMRRLMGEAAFRRASDRYFTANDGKAATIEDFLAAMAAEGLEAARFRHWYHQAGTPRVEARLRQEAGATILELAQSNPVAGASAPPLLIPIEVALFGRDGTRLTEPRLVTLAERMAEVHFEGVEAPALLSINRGFSAPVLISPDPDPADLAILAAHDDDPFARYDALQRLMLLALLASIEAGAPRSHAEVVEAVGNTLKERWRDPAFVAEAILVPSESLIGDRMDQVDPLAIRAAREALRVAILDGCAPALWDAFHAEETEARDLSPRAKGLRRLKGVAIAALLARDDAEATSAAFRMFTSSRSMTDRMAALTALASSSAAERQEALALFRARHGDDPMLLDKWFAVQAGSGRADTLQAVEVLAQDPAFDIRNPNRARALLLGFTANQARFNCPEGYRFIADQVLALDALNPSVASRVAQALTRWKRMIPPLAAAMRTELERIAAAPKLSRDLVDVVSRGLG
ncbi:aminopeptidase N [Thermaurantiacus sp.]